MLTQEQARALNIEEHALEAAELRQADAQKKMDRYYDAIKKATDAMKGATPEQRERITWLLPQLTQWYESAKLERATAEDSYWQHINNINEYKALDAAQQVTQWGGQRRRQIVVPEPEVVIESNGKWWPIITTPTFDELPENVKRMIRNQPWNPYGSISEWPWIGAWDYIKWARNWFTTTFLDPSEFVYQSNSIQPWYNFWANLGRAWTVASVLYWWLRANAPTTTINTSTYPVSNASRTLGSNYSPSYWNASSSRITPTITNTTNAANASPALRSLTPTEVNNFWKYVDANPNAPVLSTIRNFTNWAL